MQLGQLVINGESTIAVTGWAIGLTFCTWRGRHCIGQLLVAQLLMPLIVVAQTVVAYLHHSAFITKLPAVQLGWVWLLFLSLYAIWRVSGGKPLGGWPWPRVGVLAFTSVGLTDVVLGITLPATAGHGWVLGGAGLRDALYALPAAVTVIYALFLECGRRWTFCARSCRSQDACRMKSLVENNIT